MWRGSYQRKRSPRLKKLEKIFLDYFFSSILSNNRTVLLPETLTGEIWHLFLFFQVRLVSFFFHIILRL